MSKYYFDLNKRSPKLNKLLNEVSKTFIYLIIFTLLIIYFEFETSISFCTVRDEGKYE